MPSEFPMGIGGSYHENSPASADPVALSRDAGVGRIGRDGFSLAWKEDERCYVC